MGGVFAKALGRLVGKQEMRILMVRAPTARRENRSPQLPRAFSSPPMRSALRLVQSRAAVPMPKCSSAKARYCSQS